MRSNFGYVWIRLDTFGYVLDTQQNINNCLDAFGYFWIHLDSFFRAVIGPFLACGAAYEDRNSVSGAGVC